MLKQGFRGLKNWTTCEQSFIFFPILRVFWPMVMESILVALAIVVSQDRDVTAYVWNEGKEQVSDGKFVHSNGWS
jgi:hypothetical protein